MPGAARRSVLVRVGSRFPCPDDEPLVVAGRLVIREYVARDHIKLRAAARTREAYRKKRERERGQERSSVSSGKGSARAAGRTLAAPSRTKYSHSTRWGGPGHPGVAPGGRRSRAWTLRNRRAVRPLLYWSWVERPEVDVDARPDERRGGHATARGAVPGWTPSGLSCMLVTARVDSIAYRPPGWISGNDDTGIGVSRLRCW